MLIDPSERKNGNYIGDLGKSVLQGMEDKPYGQSEAYHTSSHDIRDLVVWVC